MSQSSTDNPNNQSKNQISQSQNIANTNSQTQSWTQSQLSQDNSTDSKNTPNFITRYLQKIPTPGGAWVMFILFLSMIVICDYLFRYFVPRKDDLVLQLLNYIDDFVCFFFFFDFCWRLLVAPNKFRYLYTWGWIDLLSSIPFIHAFRFLKFFYLASIIRGARSIERIFAFLFASKMSTTLLFSFLLFFTSIALASICELYFERHAQGASITSIQTAIWWAFMVASTVGNTSAVPVTTSGMILGCILTIIGYGLFSINAGLLATWMHTNMAIVEKQKNIE